MSQQRKRDHKHYVGKNKRQAKYWRIRPQKGSPVVTEEEFYNTSTEKSDTTRKKR